MATCCNTIYLQPVPLCQERDIPVRKEPLFHKTLLSQFICYPHDDKSIRGTQLTDRKMQQIIVAQSVVSNKQNVPVQLAERSGPLATASHKQSATIKLPVILPNAVPIFKILSPSKLMLEILPKIKSFKGVTTLCYETFGNFLKITVISGTFSGK